MTARLRATLVLALDAALTAFSLWAAYQLRFDRPHEYMQGFGYFLVALLVARLSSNLYARLHYWSFKLSNLIDGTRILGAGLAGTFGFVLLVYFVLRPHYELEMPARGVVVIELLLSTFFMAAMRFTPRVLWMYRADLTRWRAGGAIRTLLVGAGKNGEMLLRDLVRQEDHRLHVVGFVDDDPGKLGHVVGGRPILGTLDDLPRLSKTLRIDNVIITIHRLSPSRMRSILALGFHQKVRFQILPGNYGNLQQQDPAQVLREVSTDDLLERPALTFDHDTPNFDRHRVALVAGAGGSIGREICGQLLELGCRRLVLLDTNENDLYVCQRGWERQYPDREIVAEVADIRDRARLEHLFAAYRPRDVFHAAARKHVPLMEASPCEAVKTNVFGTLHLAEVAAAFGAERFVFTSTDKAVRPTSVMGASKRLGEQVLRRMIGQSRTAFSIVRFGNVLDSAGSVVPLFREQIAVGGPVTVTHPQVERYFMTISEAVGLVLRAAYGNHGPLCVLEMGEPMRILELARQMIAMAGLVPDVDIRIEFTGLRPGEKLFEELVAEGESVRQVIDHKIKVLDGPPPPDRLGAGLDQLRAAAQAEDAAAVRRLLQELLPDYRSVGAVQPVDVLAEKAG